MYFIFVSRGSPPDSTGLWGLVRVFCACCLIGRECVSTVLEGREPFLYNYLVSWHWYVLSANTLTSVHKHCVGNDLR